MQVRKVLRNDSSGSAALLRDILYDGDGKVSFARVRVRTRHAQSMVHLSSVRGSDITLTANCSWP